MDSERPNRPARTKVPTVRAWRSCGAKGARVGLTLRKWRRPHWLGAPGESPGASRVCHLSGHRDLQKPTPRNPSRGAKVQACRRRRPNAGLAGRPFGRRPLGSRKTRSPRSPRQGVSAGGKPIKPTARMGQSTERERSPMGARALCGGQPANCESKKFRISLLFSSLRHLGIGTRALRRGGIEITNRPFGYWATQRAPTEPRGIVRIWGQTEYATTRGQTEGPGHSHRPMGLEGQCRPSS